jgi:hypothetical protein
MGDSQDSNGAFIAGFDFIQMDDNPFISSGNVHAAHVSGIIGAKTNNGQGISGINWNVKLMPLRVCATSWCDSFAIYNAILYAAGLPNSSGRLPAQKADIINLSLGGPGPSPTFQVALQQALNNGVLPVCAAGNDGSNMDSTFFSPAGYDECMAVSAVTETLQPAYFTNYGSAIDIAAPGTNIYSTVHNNGYAAWSGTSMSSPHVAGVAALIKAVNPSASPLDIRNYLEQGATDLGAAGRDAYYGNGFLNALTAMEGADDDAVILEPKLFLAPSAMDFDPGNGYQTLTILNQGNSEVTDLDISVDYDPSSPFSWLLLRKQNDFGSTPSRVGIYADRQGLQVSMGAATTVTYSAIITVSSMNAGTVTLPVSVTVRSDEVTYPVIRVEIVQNDVPVYTTYSSYDEGYAFNWPQDINSGILRAGSDDDHDGVICENSESYCGYLGGFENPANLDGTLLYHNIDVSHFDEGFFPIPVAQNLDIAGDSGFIPLNFDLQSTFTARVKLYYTLLNSGEGPVEVPEAHLSLSEFSGNGTHQTLWDSNQLLPSQNVDLELLLVPETLLGVEGQGATATMSLRNNTPPVISSLQVDGDNREISIVAQVSDAEGDELYVKSLEYSLDATVWHTATVLSGNLDNLENPAKILWHSQYNLRSDENTVQVRLAVSDLYQSTSEVSSSFPLFNSTSPSRWDVGPNSPGGACEGGDAVSYQQTAYFFCGKSGNIQNGNILKLDFDSLTWSNPNLQLIHRFGHTATLISDQVYLWGGQGDDPETPAEELFSTLGAMEVFDTQSQSSQLGTTVGTPRSHHSAAAYQGKIHIWGGLSSTNLNLNTLEIFDVQAGTWSLGATGGTPRNQHTATVYGGKMYVLGGVSTNQFGDDTLDVYDLETGQWTSHPGMGILRYGHSAVVIDGAIIIWGGKDSNSGGPLDSILVFNPSALDDPGEDHLEMIQGAAVARHDHMATARHGKMYVWGGLTPASEIIPSTELDVYRPANTHRTLVSFGRPTRRILEGNWAVEVEIILNRTPITTSSVNVEVASGTTADGNDFGFQLLNLNFTAGSTLRTVLTIQLFDDPDPEGEETIELILSDPLGMALGEFQNHTITIVDDD